jgi:hypothetical protein
VSDSLFPDLVVTLAGPPGLPEEERTAGQRMRDRQAARIASGFHPLPYTLRLHPEAPRVLTNDRGGAEPYRCGSCVFRRLIGGHARSFSKCMSGYQEIPIPAEQQREYGPKLRIITPRATHGIATDVRAWWPACIDYEPKPPEEEAST